MNPSKFAIAVLALGTIATTINPLAAMAAPIIGSTAAAVSIKFQDAGTTSGNFSLNPSGAGTTNVIGVKEISAAIATGETRATAGSYATDTTTNATSEGYSQPAVFKYNSSSDVNTSGTSYDYAGSTAGMSFIPVAK
jgi:hypothetical protein